MSDKPLFIIIYRPPRSDFLHTQTREEIRTIEQHFQYLQKLEREGLLILAGRCEDASFGIALLRASSEAEGYKIMKNDPAVKARIFSAEIRQFRIAIKSKTTI